MPATNDYVAKVTDLDDYQIKLTPGANITITPQGVISAQNNGDTTYTGIYNDGETLGTIRSGSNSYQVKMPSITGGHNVIISRDTTHNIMTISAATGGLQHFTEDATSLYGKMELDPPQWSCLDGYGFNYAVEDHITPISSNQWSFTKDNAIPAIAVATYYTATDNYSGSGIILVSKDEDGTLYTVNTGNEYSSPVTMNGGYDYGDMMFSYGNACNMTGTYTYEDETWYYSAFTIRGASGGANVQDGNILFNALGNSFGSNKSLAAQIADLFTYVEPYSVDYLYSGLHQGSSLAFFAGATDATGADAPIKVFTDGTTQGFPGGLVDDVKVDGSSVVVNKVANIDLATPLAAKQNVLTAGANITIQNDVISATSAEYRDFQGATQLADGTNGLVPKPFKRQDNKFLQGNGGWGSAVLTGTSAPASGQGFNDNIYVEYDGTSSSTSTQLYSQRAPGGKTTWSMELDTSSYDQVRVELVWGGVDTTISVADIYSTGVTVTLASGYAYLTFDHSTVTYSNNQYFNDWILRIYGINLIITPTSCEEMYTKINGTWLPLGLQNSIHDVEVDGVSVVTSGVAEIDLSNYATLSDIPEIEANPQDTPTDQLDTLTIDGTVYELGGGDVEANPSGTATDILTKLGIEGTVYEIQGGGGGSNLIIDAQIYSTEERVVGVWIDGKPLYAKSFTLSSRLTVSATSWTNTDLSISDVEKFVNGYAISDDGTFQGSVVVDKSNDVIQLQSTRSSASYVKYLTVFYTKTTDSAGSGGYQAYGFSPIVYSEEEREVGVWTDGKPLYQRTYEYSGEYTSDNVLQMQGLSDTEHIIIVNSQCEDTGGHILFLPYANATANYVRSYYLTPQDNTFNLLCNSNSPIKNPTITLQYTKTTDTAGSCEYNTLGIPNVHYDGNEKVIGTWFGETLYERTFNGLATNTNGDNWVNIGGIDASTWKDAVNVEIYCNSSDVNNKLSRIAIGEARVFNGNVQVTTSASYNREINVATIQYTKTT